MILKIYLYYLKEWKTLCKKDIKSFYTFLKILVLLLIFLQIFLFIILKLKKHININQIVKSKTLILYTKTQCFI